MSEEVSLFPLMFQYAVQVAQRKIPHCALDWWSDYMPAGLTCNISTGCRVCSGLRAWTLLISDCRFTWIWLFKKSYFVLKNGRNVRCLTNPIKQPSRLAISDLGSIDGSQYYCSSLFSLLVLLANCVPGWLPIKNIIVFESVVAMSNMKLIWRWCIIITCQI